MSWPSNPVAVGDIITASQLNLLPIQLADTTLTVSAANFDLTSIPSGFSYLMLWLQGRSDTVASNTVVDAKFNNDSTAANYTWNEDRLDGTTYIGADTAPGTNGFMRVAKVPAASATSSYFGSAVVFIPNYAGTTAYKEAISEARGRSSSSSNTGWLYRYGGMWLSTSAISRITLTPEAGNFVAGSRVTLYGMP